MQNPIPRSSLWATPKSEQDLYDMLQGVGSAEEQRLAWHGAMLALNLAHTLVEETHIKEQV